MTQKVPVRSGLDNLAMADGLLHGCCVGLMTNQTGVDHTLRSGIDILHERYHLTALFACEHGIRGDAQAGMKVENHVDPETGVPVWSVFGATRRMTAEMAEQFDVLVFDMQDVGARFYTYLYSLSYAMEACAAAGKPVVVLDRINPLGGLRREGTIHDPRFSSFVGDYALPTRTGLTMGEYARYVKAYLGLDRLELTVVPLTGWQRALQLPDTDVPWVAPSPNCPNYASALCYIGTCVFEGTNLSEGRGTTQPFELIGAPYIDAAALADRMNALAIPGVLYRRAYFTPMFSKHAGERCAGVQLHVTDPMAFHAFEAGLRLLDTVRAMYPAEFAWRDGPDSYHLDRLLGTDAFRLGCSAEELIAAHAPKIEAFTREVQPFLLY